MNEKSIIFFDGVCGLCNGFIDFIIRRDKQNIFKMASLQGNYAKEHLKAHHDLKTVVFSHRGKLFVKSEAVLQIFSLMSFPWNLLIIFRIFPRFMRDYFYDIVAKNRYEIFGKRDTCRLPNEKEKEYFLD